MVFTVNAKGEKNKELTRRGERINGNYWNVKGSAENFQFRFLNSQIHRRRFSRENSKSVCVRERLTWRHSICIRASVYLVSVSCAPSASVSVLRHGHRPRSPFSSSSFDHLYVSANFEICPSEFSTHTHTHTHFYGVP